MRRIYFSLTLALIVTCLFSCKKDDKGNASPSRQSLIVGTWELQQQHYLMYVDGVKQKDTTYFASQNLEAEIEFTSTNTFTSASALSTGVNGGLSGGATAANSSTSGTYSFTGTAFSMSAPIAGLDIGSGSFGTTTVVPVITAVS